MLGIHAATGAEMMNELIDVVGAELKQIADRGALDSEVARAKSQLKAGLLMALESSSARAERWRATCWRTVASCRPPS